MGYLDQAGLAYFWGKVKTALSGKQDTITAGDGVEITQTAAGPEIGLTAPVRGIVTQAEFDALPEAKQNKGLYVISDGGEGGGSSGETYSAGETRIGTWIDGKPLYRSVFTYNGSSPLNTDTYIPSTPANIDKCIFFDGYGIRTNGSMISVNNSYIFAAYYPTKKKLLLFPSMDSVTNASWTFVLEYTKTTDKGATT